MSLTKNRIVSAGITGALFALGLFGPLSVFAATTPSLGAASTYGILSSTYTNTVAGTTVNGDIGFTTPPAVVPLGVHANYGSGAPYAQAGVDVGNAATALDSQPCTFTFAPGAIDLSTDITHGPVGIYAPGVYCSTGAMNIGGPLNLNGAGTYIFRPIGAFTSTVGAVVTLTGSSACDVFWSPSSASTLAANTTFVGNVISSAGITVGANATWIGRSLAFGGTVTTDTNTITVPSCVVPPVPGGGSNQPGTVNVVKLVINDNGGTKVVSDFSLYVGNTQVTSGITNNFAPVSGVYTVTETGAAGYTQSFSGDCDVNGQFNLLPGQNKFCIVTNDDIGAPVIVPPVPPLIDVLKVPNPLSLPNGPGPVLYTYSLRNIGTVPVTDITMVGDTCAPIVRVSGDTNGNSILEVNEVWVHTCSTNLTQTHTNTVVATGWANGLTATDIASATVVVGLPIVPPLIHVTKVPSTFVFLAGGGTVIYTEKITNPGTVALHNVGLNDDKCSVQFVTGDTNGDSLLDVNETWSYSCSANLTQTTTNTATATGEANGIIVKDLAVVTVVVAAAVPTLPQAGAEPMKGETFRLIALALFAGTASVLLALRRKKRTS